MTLLPAPEHHDHWLERVCAGSEMGERVLAHDWAATPLGPPATWSAALRAAVGMCLSSRFPMLVVWGADLVKIYNDGYRELLGSEKHPRALGAPAREIWPEIWDTIGPMLEGVLDTGEPTWTEDGLLLIDRNGFTEECYFVWSYSALYEHDGRIGGVLDVVTETTREVVAQRRLACLAELRGALASAEQVTDVCLRATATLARFTADVRTADLYLLVGDDPVLVASNRRDDLSSTPPGDVADVAASREARALGRHDGVVPTAERYLMPIGTSRTEVRGVMDVALNRMRPFDETYAEFLGLVGATIGTALDNAYRRAVELGEFRAISDTLQAAMLRPASDLPTVAARYVPAAGNLAVGGDWYDVIDLGPDHRGRRRG